MLVDIEVSMDVLTRIRDYFQCDVFSTYRDGTQIGESAMIVIDSETGEFEKL